MKIRIEITKGPDSGREFVLDSNQRLTIGRGGESEIRMTDGLISREHCEVNCDGHHLLLCDLGSTNKTFLAYGSRIEPVEPKKIYKVEHQSSFFAGPESRFTATYLPSETVSDRDEPIRENLPSENTSESEPPSSSSGGNSAAGNFSNSIDVQPGSFGASSIFNLLGDVPHSASSVQFNTRPSEPTKPAPIQSDHAPQRPQQREDLGAFDSSSIAAPQNQGGSRREQPQAHPPKDVRPQTKSRDVPPTIEYYPQDDDSNVFSNSLETQHGNPPKAPRSSEEQSSPPKNFFTPNPRAANPIDNGSIVPPHLQGVGKAREQVGETHDAEILKSTPVVEKPKKNRPPSSPAPETDRDDDSNVFSSSAHNKSIAAPGHVYEMRRPAEDLPASAPSQNSSAFEASVHHPVLPQQDMSGVTRETPLAAEPITRQSKTEQHNGLHFHTGTESAQLDGLIAELAVKAAPIYCVDFSRLEIDPPVEKPAAEPTGKAPTTAETDKKLKPIKVNESAFEDDSEDEDMLGLGTEKQTTPAKLIGTPLFDFLPEGHKQNGPILLTQPELNCGLANAWGHDAVVVFFGPDPIATTEHLKTLLHTNVQTGKIFKGMFGFCWPSVLHTLFESQGEDQVKRVFGDTISHILLEDPQQRYAWNLVALSDQTGAVQSLGSV